MGKISELTTKVNPVWADLVTWLDSEDANLSTKNKNFTISSIWDKSFSDKTTDNLTEWVTNLYYTDTRVDNNSTVVSLWVNKEDKSNKTDNITTDTWSTTKYPTVNAVENYVLNQWININWLTEKTSVVDNDEFVIYDSVWLDNKKLWFDNLKNSLSDLYVFPWTTTTYYSQWSTTVNNTTTTFTYTATKNWRYRLNISCSQSVTGSGWWLYVEIDWVRLPIWSTDPVLSQVIKKEIWFSAWENYIETYFIDLISWQDINIVASAWANTLTVNSITITWT